MKARTQNVVMVRKTSGNPLRSLLTRLLAAEKNATSWPVPVSTGLSDWPFPESPVEETLTSAVLAVQPVLNPLHVFRTYTCSPLVLVATRFEASEENATNCAVLPMLGDSHNPFAGDVPFDATETSDVAGVQTLPWPVHKSRKYISCIGVAGAPGRFVAAEANAINRPFALMFGSMLVPFANAVPSGVETSCPVFGVQPVPAPMHSVIAYTCCTPVIFPAMFVAVEANVTTCPNAPDATDGWPLGPSAGAPLLDAEINVVDGAHVPPALKHVSRKYISGVPVVAPATRFVAVETNATKRPSALIATWELASFAGLTPSLAMDTRLTTGIQPKGAPAHVLATKTCGVVPLNVTEGTRLVANEMNASSSPVEFIAGSDPAPFAITPLGPESMSLVLGMHDDVVPRHESNRKISGTPFVSGLVVGS